MPKYLTNSKFFDDGAGVHIENGFIECLDLFINQISVEDLIQATADLIDIEITALQTDVAALQTTLTTCSYDSGTQTFVIGNNLKCLGTFTLYIGGVPYNVNTFITTTNTNIATNTTDITNIKTTLTNVTYDNTYNAFQIGGTTDCRILNTLYLYSSGVPYSMNVFVTNTNTNIVSLVNKTQDISYSSGLTTIEKLSFNTFINGTSKANFENIMTTCFDLSGNCQAQIDGAYAAAAAAAGAAAAALVAANTFTTSSIATYATAQALVDLGQDGSIDALEGKLTTYTYDATNNVVSITSRVNCNSFGDLNFNGSLNQNNVNAQNDLYGNTYYHNHLRSANGAAIFAQDVDLTGNLTVTGTATITAATTLNGNVTVTNTTTNFNGTTTQIGTTSASTLNTYSTANFYGPTTIRNNSTTSSGTIAPYLNVSSIVTNTNARKLQGVCIGVESLLANEANCNIGYNYISSANANNYGYLGLNVGSFNVYECLRWSPSKVTISNGNLEVANNSTILGSLTCNTLQNSGATNFAITSTGAANNLVLTSANNLNLFATNSVKLNSNLIEVGTNQGASANNVVSIGTTNSNTTTNVPNGIKTNILSPYNTGNSVNVNGLTINVGTNEGVGAVNSINIGSVTSGSVINLNGLVNSTFNLNITGLLTQF